MGDRFEVGRPSRFLPPRRRASACSSRRSAFRHPALLAKANAEIDARPTAAGHVERRCGAGRARGSAVRGRLPALRKGVELRKRAAALSSADRSGRKGLRARSITTRTQMRPQNAWEVAVERFGERILPGCAGFDVTGWRHCLSDTGLGQQLAVAISPTGDDRRPRRPDVPGVVGRTPPNGTRLPPDTP
jgi:hypothetical protein